MGMKILPVELKSPQGLDTACSAIAAHRSEGGDLIGSGASQEQAIVGETPNLAARLSVAATPHSRDVYILPLGGPRLYRRIVRRSFVPRRYRRR